MTRLLLALSFVLFGAVSSALLAADWAQFRGPNRDNISPDKGLLKTWPKAGPKLVWEAEGVGQGFSSVSVAGNKVYTMGDLKGASFLFALSRSTGKPAWSAKVGAPGGNYRGTRCTPTVDGERVYGLGQFGDLICVNATTGKEIWRKNLSKDFNGRPGGWNYTESVLIDGERLICTPGGQNATVVALDKMTGKEIWRSPIDSSAGYSSVVISNAGNVKQYVQLTANGTVGISAKDGQVLWKYTKLGNNTANIPTPVVLGQQVFTTAGYGKGAALLTLNADGSGGVDAKEEYFTRALNNKHGGVVVVGDFVYGDTDDSGNPYCAEWKTGKIKWTRRKSKTPGEGGGSASVTYADGHLYVRYADGWVHLVPVPSESYTPSSSFKIKNSDTNSWAHPVVIDGMLYLREKDRVWCYDVKGK